MGRNSFFQFKQFQINQMKAAMKVGTDGVLLGAWVDVSNAETMLDVGTGTGVIALMLAQRSNARITALEIEKKAAEEAAENVANSLWKQRVSVLNTSLQNFVKTSPGSFSIIVSNPPFFTNSRKSKCNYLAMARHNHLLPPEELIDCSFRLLLPEGRLAIILPALSADEFIKTAENSGLFLIRKTQVRPNNLKKPHRFVSLLPTSSCWMNFWPLTSRHAKKSKMQQRGDVPGHRVMAGKRFIPDKVLFP